MHTLERKLLNLIKVKLLKEHQGLLSMDDEIEDQIQANFTAITQYHAWNASVHFMDALRSLIDVYGEKKIFGENNGIHFWWAVEGYLRAVEDFGYASAAESAFLKMKKLFDSIYDGFRDKDRQAGTVLLPLELVNPYLIQRVYSSKDDRLTTLFKEHFPQPRAYVFSDTAVPQDIAAQQEEAVSVIEKYQDALPVIKKIQRTFRYKKRIREELVRIQQELPAFLNERKLQAQDLITDANTPYAPQRCGKELSQRIVAAAGTIELFDSVRHETSCKSIVSILNDALYGRRTLLEFYMKFSPAALADNDILSGDGNSICLGAYYIDPRAVQLIDPCSIIFDIDSISRDLPVTFFKQRDFGFGKPEFRNVSLENSTLFFSHTHDSPDKKVGFTSFQLKSEDGEVEYSSELPEASLISYNIQNIEQILILNFFRFLDNLRTPTGEIAQDVIDDIYSKIEEIDDNELAEFLFDLGQEISDTMEFNFYGAYQIDFATIRAFTTQNGTIEMQLFIERLNSGDLDALSEAKIILPQLLQSYRFIDYLLTQVQHPAAQEGLNSIRTTCQPPILRQEYPSSSKRKRIEASDDFYTPRLRNK